MTKVVGAPSSWKSRAGGDGAAARVEDPDETGDWQVARKLEKMIQLAIGMAPDGDAAIHVSILRELLDTPATFRVEAIFTK